MTSYYCLTIDLIACGLCPVSKLPLAMKKFVPIDLKDVFSTTRSKPSFKKPHLHHKSRIVNAHIQNRYFLAEKRLTSQIHRMYFYLKGLI